MSERPTHPVIEKLRARREVHAQRHLVYRIAVAIAGVVLILFGLFLALPGVPGPGLVIVAVGLGLLALEWDPAERMLERIVDKLEDARDASRPTQVALVAGGVLLGIASLALTAVFFDVPILPF
jgi:uncharacterized protein (TIGR02611 family)